MGDQSHTVFALKAGDIITILAHRPDGRPVEITLDMMETSVVLVPKFAELPDDPVWGSFSSGALTSYGVTITGDAAHLHTRFPDDE